MAKARLAIATALLAAMTIFASAGGVSFESRGYGGPLYVGPDFHSSSPSSQESNKKKRVYRATKERKARATKEVDTAKVAPAKGDAENENSTISGASPDASKPGADTTVDTAKTTQNENSSISQASLDADKTVEESTVEGAAKANDQPKTTQNLGCKKYFPTAGMTLSVPCE